MPLCCMIKKLLTTMSPASSGILRASYLVAIDIPEGPVNAEQGKMIPLTGDEFPPDRLHFIPPGRGIVEDAVHG